ncbi:MAG: hypothetical protein ABIZ49_13910 [Opitutaceae bacterium]
MSDDPGNEPSYFVRLVRAFWQGATQPCVGAALGALGLTLAGAIFIVASSTEARVRATDPAAWMSSPTDDFGRQAAFVIQGAERHARGRGTMAVFIGPSMLQSLLPAGADLDQALTAGAGQPVRGLDLSALALNYMEEAAVVERFGSAFEGWLVLGVNRYALARNFQEDQERKKRHGFLVEFDSRVLDEELQRAGFPPARRWGVPFLDHTSLYRRSLAGYRFAERSPHGYVPPTHAVKERILNTPGKILASLPVRDAAAFEANLAILGRMAERQRRAGGARVVLVECPFADEVTPALHSPEWREEREQFIRRRNAWSAEHNTPWIDVAAELGVRPEDFYDPLHVHAPAVRRRFVELVARRLAALQP